MFPTLVDGDMPGGWTVPEQSQTAEILQCFFGPDTMVHTIALAVTLWVS